MNRLAMLAVVLVCVPATAGCYIPYAFLSVERTPAVPLREVAGQVRVIRADYTTTGNCCTGLRVRGQRLSFVPLDGEDAVIPPQSRLALHAGIFQFAVALNHDYGSHDRVEVRLYRPGFNTLVIDGTGDESLLTWVEAETTSQREHAIDLVWQPWSCGSPPGRQCVLKPPDSILSGAVCDFAACEYERLAAAPTLAPVDRQRITAKARSLRDRTPARAEHDQHPG